MSERGKKAAAGATEAGTKGSEAPKKRAWYERYDPFTSLLLTIPIFLIYHLGILAIDLRNGVDLVSGLMVQLVDFSVAAYAGLTLGVAVALGVAAWILRAKNKMRPLAWLPMLGESLLLAIVMLLLVGWATNQLFADQIGAQIGGRSMGPLEKLVMACGAGFHEELVFRVGLFAGGAWLLTKVAKLGRLQALLLAGFVSSVIFSGVHYVGSLGDPFTLVSFTFRVLSGVYLAAVYHFRGFAVAVYTHAIYDLIIFFLVQ